MWLFTQISCKPVRSLQLPYISGLIKGISHSKYWKMYFYLVQEFYYLPDI